jgi:hypothetical protein
MRQRRLALGALLLAAAGLAYGLASRPTAEELARMALEERWGVRPVSLRYSADGLVLDFRYRIVDPAKAQPLVDRRFNPYLTDEANGTRLAVPTDPKIGPLRQTNRYGAPKEGRVYFVLFANPGRLVKPGSKVTVHIGDFAAAHLVVS